MAKNDCPCGSGLRYTECCRPLHRGVREAADAVQLMRSRYSAYAMKEAPYLWKTLAASHEDRRRAEEEVLREIRHSASVFKYTGLKVLDSQPPDEAGVAKVLFYARVFQNGRNLSFVELSDFVQEEGAWRYRGGVMKSLASLGAEPERLTIATFGA